MASIGTTVWIKVERRPCFVDCNDGEKKAFCHKWIEEDKPIVKCNTFHPHEEYKKIRKDIFETAIYPSVDIFTIKETLGLVEYEDGTMAKIEPTRIRFDVEREKMVIANSMGETYDIEKHFAEIEKKYTEE
jgi:hypothetical protein